MLSVLVLAAIDNWSHSVLCERYQCDYFQKYHIGLSGGVIRKHFDQILVLVLEAVGPVEDQSGFKQVTIPLWLWEHTKSCRDLKEVRKTINDIHILLLNRKPLPDNYCAAFLKNPTRASSFFKVPWRKTRSHPETSPFQSIWTQIESEVLQINRDSFTPKPRSESRFSISSFRSALSTMSINSSVFTRITMDDKVLRELKVMTFQIPNSRQWPRKWTFCCHTAKSRLTL